MARIEYDDEKLVTRSFRKSKTIYYKDITYFGRKVGSSTGKSRVYYWIMKTNEGTVQIDIPVNFQSLEFEEFVKTMKKGNEEIKFERKKIDVLYILIHQFSHFHDIMIPRWIMYIDYSKLWNKLADMGIKNKTELIPLAGISSNILAKLSKGDYISMESLQKICKALKCDVGDICVVNDVNSEEK